MKGHQDVKAETKEKPSTEKPSARHAAKAAASENGLARKVYDSLSTVERTFETGGDGVWRALKQRPMLGVGVAAAAGLGLAVTVGASELAIAFVTGYAAYQVLKKNEPPSKALEEAAKLRM